MNTTATIGGVISTREVLFNARQIVQDFGGRVFFRCCVALVLRRRTTFLACVWG